MARVLAAVLIGALLAGCSTGTDAVDQEAGGQQRFVSGDGSRTEFPPDERRKPVALTGELLDGERFELSSLRGKVVVLNFWGSWCAPCRAEAGDLQKVHEATKEAGVEFVGVNVRDSRDSAQAFERAFGISYPSVFDQSMRVALTLRDTPPNAIPATVVLDRSGRVAVVIRKPLTDEDLTPVIERALAEQP